MTQAAISIPHRAEVARFRETRTTASVRTMFAILALAFPQTSRSVEPTEGKTSPVNSRQEVESVAMRLEQHFELNALDATRLHLWSRFGTVERLARELDVSTSSLQAYLHDHRWALFDAPALKFQNRSLDSLDVTDVSTGTSTRRQFATADGKESDPATETVIAADRDALVISVTCQEPQLNRLASMFPREDPRSPRERWYWDGDLVALKNEFRKNRRDVQQWAEKQTDPPKQSVLLDDCIIVFLTPVDIGNDSSHLFPAPFVPDPARWIDEQPANTESQIYLKGAYYAVAINPNGAVLDVFFDPWDSGTICPAWKSRSDVKTRKTKDSWSVDIRIPWKSLKPGVNEDSVWGLDFARIRRCGQSPGELTRSNRSTFVRYDQPVQRFSPSAIGATPTVRVSAIPDANPDSFPTGEQWKESATLKTFRDISSGRKVDDIQARITHDAKQLFVRFDCQERSLARLKVVSTEEELDEYGHESRKLNYLDRREQFGLDWGDYVEVTLTPNLDFADRHHGGLFTFLINSDGDLLERSYDTYGMFNVLPHPVWASGARTQITKSDGTWSVELAIPLEALCTMGQVSSRWGLNLHRCRSHQNSGHGERHLCWSPTGPPVSAPGWPATLVGLRDGGRLGTMYVDPKAIKLDPGAKGPQLALARSDASRQAVLAGRDRSSDRLASVCFVDRKFGWAVGGLGTILHTMDGGKTWKTQRAATDFILEKVFFLDRKQGWAIGGWPRDSAVALLGGMGVILATSDGGNTWHQQLDGEATWLSDVHFLDEKRGCAVGEYGTILKTTDGGQTWRQIKRTTTSRWLYGISFADSLNGIAVGHDETILRTSDAGESWERCACPVPRRANGWPAAFRAVAFRDEKNGWIVGDGGSILRTTDAGQSWDLDEIELPSETIDLASFEDLSIAPNGTAWAVSPLMMLSKKQDDAKWTHVPTGQGGILRGVHFPDSKTGWLVGDRSLVLRTVDGGIKWKQQLHSARKMKWLYATAHDHHINSSAMSILSESADTAYVCLHRGVRPFELNGDYNRAMVAASAMAAGIPVVHSFVEFDWRLRNEPHLIAERYQNFHGLDGVQRRLVAMIRTLRPEILVAEQPVTQEDYYAHGVGEIARAQIRAFKSAADPKQFPELLALGLKPYAPKQLYVVSSWATDMYQIHPTTYQVPGATNEFSERLGMTLGEASARSRNCFWGLLDRSNPPARSRRISPWNLHLKNTSK